MTDYKFREIMGQLREIKARLDAIEDNSPQGESGAVACSPAEAQVSLPRSPDRQTLSEFKAKLKMTLMLASQDCVPIHFKPRFEMHCKSIIQELDTLDRGPIAKPLTEKEIQERRWNTFKSPYGQ